jgi:hypothetical protein
MTETKEGRRSLGSSLLQSINCDDIKMNILSGNCMQHFVNPTHSAKRGSPEIALLFRYPRLTPNVDCTIQRETYKR